VQKSSIPVNDL